MAWHLVIPLRCAGQVEKSPVAFQAAGGPVLLRRIQDREIFTPVPQNYVGSEREGPKNEATNQYNHKVVAKPPATLALEEEVAKLAAEIHPEKPGQHSAAAKNKAQNGQPVDGFGVSQLIEVVNELGHVSELVRQNRLHVGNLVLPTQPPKQIIVRLLAGDVIEMPVAAEIEEFRAQFVHHGDAGQRQPATLLVLQQSPGDKRTSFVEIQKRRTVEQGHNGHQVVAAVECLGHFQI